jgi:hypothetical protein
MLWKVLSALAGAVGLFLLAAADDPPPPGRPLAVAPLKEAPPEALSAEIRKALTGPAFRVTDAKGKVICDLWFRSPLPVLADFEPQLDLQYPLEPGTWVGAMRLPTKDSDFRKQAVKPGVYTLRYGHQPQDGNHLGTAQYRDFLTLAPAAADKDPARLKEEASFDLSKKATGTTHPAIYSLLPPQKGRRGLPAIVRDQDMDFDIFVAEIACKPDSRNKCVQLELIVVGHSAE